MTNYTFDAVIFDLDGVITQTALVHSAAWEKMFNTFLAHYAQANVSEFTPFTHENDYLPFVDGKPRYKGVESFLLSRNITLPFGTPDDLPSEETICALGNMKNEVFNEILEKEGIKVYPSTVKLIHDLKEAGIHIGVASSSKNCKKALKAAGLLDLFEVRIDGEVSAEIGLNGKPEPDIFTTAADRMKVSYHRSVVIEDAVSGVAAGKKGGFGFVLGIAREKNERALYVAGADRVVNDIAELGGLDGIQEWYDNGLKEEISTNVYRSYNPESEKSRESLLTIGNGYFGTRGADEESAASDHHYPGTYIAGLYNKLPSQVGDREIFNEDFVNCPNWLPFTFRIGEDAWFHMDDVAILDYEKRIDFGDGLMERYVVVEDKKGRQTGIYSSRIASMENPHLAAQKYAIEPLNWKGEVTLRAGIDGHLINDGVKRYAALNQHHLTPVDASSKPGHLSVVVKTTQSEVTICETATVTFLKNQEEVVEEQRCIVDNAAAFIEQKINIKQGEVFEGKKVVSIYTSKDNGVLDCEKEASTTLASAGDFSSIYRDSLAAWADIWDKIVIEVEGDRESQKLLHMHQYHTMVGTSSHNLTIDAGLTARGLHGEAYRGHVFWDEIFILPFYVYRLPAIAKALLMYRYNRLPEAKQYAADHHYKGAMFPWQSGSTGEEETQIVHLNPISGKWGPDFSCLQRHVSLAIAYNCWLYVHATEDNQFFEQYGAEMMIEIARFWHSKMEWRDDIQRYSIKEVMGPDEFHENYTNSEKGGLTDNAYTNIMTVWLMKKILQLTEKLGDDFPIWEKTGCAVDELETWYKRAKQLHLEINEEGIIAQFEGYFDLEEIDWTSYRSKYDNISRLDRILKAEGKEANSVKVAKQADTLQLFFNLPSEEVTSLLRVMGYQLPEDYIKRNLDYYLARTSHGSTLSRVVHSQLANIVGEKALSWDLFKQALNSDFVDIQGGTTAEGIHSGVMASTSWGALPTFVGVDLRGEIPTFTPNLPECWESIRFDFTFKNIDYGVLLDEEMLSIVASDNSAVVKVFDKEITVEEGVDIALPLEN